MNGGKDCNFLLTSSRLAALLALLMPVSREDSYGATGSGCLGGNQFSLERVDRSVAIWYFPQSRPYQLLWFH